MFATLFHWTPKAFNVTSKLNRWKDTSFGSKLHVVINFEARMNRSEALLPNSSHKVSYGSVLMTDE